MTKFRTVFETVSTAVIAGAALVALGFYIYDRTDQPGQLRMIAQAPIDGWEEANGQGLRIGPPDAGIVVTEFLDFTCPFCKSLVPVIDSLMHEFPDDVALVVQHFPLGREHSVPSAIAAECAERQGQFPDMYYSLFANADSFGAKSWRSIAEEAGVPDLVAFDHCMGLPSEAFPRIAAGRQLGQELELTGTPSVLINGRRFRGRDLHEFRTAAVEIHR